jgi:hypothetical protein
MADLAKGMSISSLVQTGSGKGQNLRIGDCSDIFRFGAAVKAKDAALAPEHQRQGVETVLYYILQSTRAENRVPIAVFEVGAHGTANFIRNFDSELAAGG